MKIKALLSVFVILMFLSSCTGNSFINSSTDEPTIKVKDGVFNVSIDECINILNQEIESENLTPIPTDYEVIEHDGWTAYEAKVSDYIMIRFVEYDDLAEGIVRIGVAALDSYEYEKGDKKISMIISNDEKEISKMYYERICQMVKPSFNPKPFMESGETGSAEFGLDGLLFLTSHTSAVGELYENEGGNASEKNTINEVVSSETFYKENVDDIMRGDDISFHFNY